MGSLSDKPTLRGERIELRPFTPADVDAMGPILADPEVLRLTGSVASTAAAQGRSPELDERTRDWYESRAEQPDRLERERPLERDPKRDLVTRTWTTGSGRAVTTLRLVLGPEAVLDPPPSSGPAAARDENDRIVGPVLMYGSITGHPVAVRGRTGGRGYDASLHAAWSIGAGRTATLTIGGAAPLPWTPERLLDAARSLADPARAD